jgi:hypothetical protein
MGEDFVEESFAEGAVQAVPEGADQTLPVADSGELADRAFDELDRSGRVRERRATLVSPIPALLAASMTTLVESKGPIVPTPLPGKLVAAQRAASAALAQQPAEPGTSSTYTVEMDGGSGATGYDLAVELLGAARRSFEGRDFHTAARLAEEALSTGEAVGTPEATSLLEDSQPLFERVFASFVGPLGATPTLATTWDQILTYRLGDSTRSFLRRIDGVRTLEQTLGHSSIPPQHALRIAASALRAGFIRVG